MQGVSRQPLAARSKGAEPEIPFLDGGVLKVHGHRRRGARGIALEDRESGGTFVPTLRGVTHGQVMAATEGVIDLNRGVRLAQAVYRQMSE